MRPPDCCILVPSCGAYADLWEPFLRCLAMFGAGCPFPLYISSDTPARPDDRYRLIYTGPPTNWSEELQRALHCLTWRYVLLMLEDFFLRKAVAWDRILDALTFLEVHAAHMVRLVPRPGPTLPIVGSSDFGLVEVGAPYRVSLQASIWRRETLLALLRAGESPWEFELAGTVRSYSISGGFFASWDTLLDYGHHGVERGLWFPGVIKRLRKTVGETVAQGRGTLSLAQRATRTAGVLRVAIAKLLPWRWNLWLSWLGKRIAKRFLPRPAVGRIGV